MPKEIIPRICAVVSCGNKHRAKGLCDKHYQRQKTYGRITLIRREKGAGHITANGYMLHGGATKGKLKHRSLAEDAIGRPLPRGAVVHHVDGDKLNNAPSNLVICQSQKYHALLHIRQHAYDACGDANRRKCWICQKYDDVNNVTINTNNQASHTECNAAYAARLRANV